MAKKMEAAENALRPKYDWEQWTDGDIWLIERGKDYTCSDQSFRVYAQQYARRAGMKVRTGKHPDGIVIQFTPKAPPPSGKKKLRRK